MPHQYQHQNIRNYAPNGTASHLRGTVSLNFTQKNMFKQKL
jgi:hypothetical protein